MRMTLVEVHKLKNENQTSAHSLPYSLAMIRKCQNAHTLQELDELVEGGREDLMMRIGIILRKLNQLTGEDETRTLLEALRTLINRLGKEQDRKIPPLFP